MSYTIEHVRKFEELQHQIENKDQLPLNANGGNCILFIYSPDEERSYTEKAKEIYRDKAAFIDIGELFVQYIDTIGWNDFKEYYRDFSSTPHKVFHSEDPSEPDLFKMVIQAVESACEQNKIPFLIRTGCLLCTGIENINIMEDARVIALPHPLVVFYPSKVENGSLLFLNFKSASKYRCTIVE